MIISRYTTSLGFNEGDWQHATMFQQPFYKKILNRKAQDYVQDKNPALWVYTSHIDRIEANTIYMNVYTSIGTFEVEFLK